VARVDPTPLQFGCLAPASALNRCHHLVFWRRPQPVRWNCRRQPSSASEPQHRDQTEQGQ
jgi:hypothetical protein